MRMWMIEPRILCRRHLLGEHVEIHMLAGSIIRKKSLEGFVSNGLVEPSAMLRRHDALAKEMRRRGYRHVSPLEELEEDLVAALSEYPESVRMAQVDPGQALQELLLRCPDCLGRAQRLGPVERAKIPGLNEAPPKEDKDK